MLNISNNFVVSFPVIKFSIYLTHSHKNTASCEFKRVISYKRYRGNKEKWFLIFVITRFDDGNSRCSRTFKIP